MLGCDWLERVTIVEDRAPQAGLLASRRYRFGNNEHLDSFTRLERKIAQKDTAACANGGFSPVRFHIFSIKNIASNRT
jgi:hypothetical protein